MWFTPPKQNNMDLKNSNFDASEEKKARRQVIAKPINWSVCNFTPNTCPIKLCPKVHYLKVMDRKTPYLKLGKQSKLKDDWLGNRRHWKLHLR